MPNRTPRILYIDDDPGLARLVQKAVERHGHVFEHVSSGEAGLERIAQGGIDVVVLDHYLPSGTGLDVLAQLNGITDRPAVVYVTGSVETAVAIAALKAGAADYVHKTVDEDFLQLLLSAVDHAVKLISLNRAKMLADQEVRDARERAEMLLGEVNHRVANSLAMVASLVGLQANAIQNEEAKDALRETQARIQAIAGVHRHLYTSDDVRTVQLDDYLRSLAAELETTMRAWGGASQISLAIETQSIATETAATLGVIVTELVTNALKYAYARDYPGEVRIGMSTTAGEHVLTVEDDGVGYDGTGAPQGTGLGSRLVKAMASGLGGKVAYSRREQGTRVSLSFPA
ncbi:MAG: histidine kinase dimerization/phosphoacceptor domain -containing protein [Devosia sp.]